MQRIVELIRLWFDEAATGLFARLPWNELLYGVGRQQPNPPGFYIIDKLVGGVAGFSDRALRLPPVVFGLLGLLLVTLLTMEAISSGRLLLQRWGRLCR